MTVCERCHDPIEGDPRPVVTGHTRETKEVPAVGEPSDPAFVQRWDTVVETKPETITVCKECHDPEEDTMPKSKMWQTRRRR